MASPRPLRNEPPDISDLQSQSVHEAKGLIWQTLRAHVVQQLYRDGGGTKDEDPQSRGGRET